MTQKSAHEEPWWDEFVSAYGDTPLRELARRFETNPRRLRRAAQRAGLADEPLAIRKNTVLLGNAPDASVAQKLAVTVEQVAGARNRRGIAAFDKFGKKRKAKAKPKAPRAPEAAAPAAPPRRVEPAEPVVVSRARLSRSDSARELPGGRGLGKRLKKLTPEPEVVTRRSVRRRVVSPDKAEEVRDKKDEPEPPAPTRVRRRPTPPKPAPVKIVYARPGPSPEPAREPSPEPAARPLAPSAEARSPAPDQYFRATYDDGSQRVVVAPDLARAAARAAEEGRVSELVPAPLLSPAG